jgi:hypothetical protein
MNAQIVWEQYKAVQEYFPDLVLTFEDNKYFIRGTLHFRAQYMEVPISEAFLIELEILTIYPRSLPIVRELGGRIPNEFHKFINGTLCLGSPLAMRMSFSNDPTLLGFIKELIIPYLYSFSRYEHNNHELPYGELSHNGKGLLEYYLELFQVSSVDKIMQILYYLSSKRIRGHLPCPCGSNLITRNCHGPMLLELYKYQEEDEFIKDLVICWKYINGE